MQLRKTITLLFVFLSCAMMALAQGAMTDKQVLDYTRQAMKAGKSQQDIAKELVARGVTRQQAERVKKLYQQEQEAKASGSSSTAQTGEERSHKTNGYNPNQRGKRGNLHNVDDTGYDDEGTETGTDARNRRVNTLETLEDSIYGRDLFSTDDLNFAPSENLATPANYKLGPGDEVIIDIFGANQATVRQVISPEGSINVDVLGPIYLNGKTVDDANAYLKKRLSAIYAGLNRTGNSDIVLSLGQIRTIQVSIIGEVAYPGTYSLSSLSTLYHALYRSGGVVGSGTMRDILVTRNGRTIAHGDVYDFLQTGSRHGDINLQDGDVIVVNPYKVLVKVNGKVKRPQYFEMKEGESLKTLLAYAGGFAQGAYTKNITIIRQNGRQYEVCNVDEFDFANFKIQDGDVIEVGELLSRFDNRVEVKGAVYKTGLYQLSSANTVRSLIQKADGLLPEAFLARAVLRRERPNRTHETLSIDIQGIMDGTSPDVPLRNNDELFIPSIFDIHDVGTITIEGEVIEPDTYPYSDNTTVEDLIIMAGGLTEAASLARVDVVRRVADQKASKAGTKLSDTFSFSLKDGFVVSGDPAFTLQPYDIVIVRRSPGFEDPDFITVTGEVNFTGRFPITHKSMRLSQAVEAAGGVTDMAYVKGARLMRRITPEERRQMNEIVKSMKASQEDRDSLNMESLDLGDVYYVGIDLDKALAKPGSSYDVVLRDGDQIEVPVFSNVVRVSGAVVSSSALAYEPGKRTKFYINNAGGYAQNARKGNTYAIEMNGHIRRVSSRTKIEPGSEIIVPSKVKNPQALSQILSVATTSASLATMIASIANMIKK